MSDANSACPHSAGHCNRCYRSATGFSRGRRTDLVQDTELRFRDEPRANAVYGDVYKVLAHNASTGRVFVAWHEPDGSLIALNAPLKAAIALPATVARRVESSFDSILKADFKKANQLLDEAEAMRAADPFFATLREGYARIRDRNEDYLIARKVAADYASEAERLKRNADTVETPNALERGAYNRHYSRWYYAPDYERYWDGSTWRYRSTYSPYRRRIITYTSDEERDTKQAERERRANTLREKAEKHNETSESLLADAQRALEDEVTRVGNAVQAWSNALKAETLPALPSTPVAADAAAAAEEDSSRNPVSSGGALAALARSPVALLIALLIGSLLSAMLVTIFRGKSGSS